MQWDALMLYGECVQFDSCSNSTNTLAVEFDIKLSNLAYSLCDINGESANCLILRQIFVLLSERYVEYRPLTKLKKKKFNVIRTQRWLMSIKSAYVVVGNRIHLLLKLKVFLNKTNITENTYSHRSYFKLVGSGGSILHRKNNTRLFNSLHIIELKYWKILTTND